MFATAMGAAFRRYEERAHEGKPARVVVLGRTFHIRLEDLWDTLTRRERIPQWFLPIEGDLRLGGRYQLQGNAGGAITRCVPPRAFEVTWEFGGGMSWVTVRLEPEGDGTRLTLAHIVHASDVDDHWAKFGPGAAGVGWDLAYLGLGKYLDGGGAPVDREAAFAWMTSEEGKAFMRASAAAWGAAHIWGGEDEAVARGMAERTASFYTGG